MINKNLSCLKKTLYDNKVCHTKKNVSQFSAFLNKNVKSM